MSQISLVADTGRSTGSGAANRLRAAGKVPGVVYGHGSTPVAVAVDHRELRHALSGPAGVNAVIDLTVDGKAQPTVVKDLQRHPIRRTVTHIDFLIVRMDEAIVVDVPILLEGEPKQVLNEGGVIEHTLAALSVNATPASIPNDITVDISSLAVGDTIRVGDLQLPTGVTTDVDPDTLVVIASVTRAAIEEEEAAPGEEGEEAAEGAADESDSE